MALIHVFVAAAFALALPLATLAQTTSRIATAPCCGSDGDRAAATVLLPNLEEAPAPCCQGLVDDAAPADHSAHTGLSADHAGCCTHGTAPADVAAAAGHDPGCCGDHAAGGCAAMKGGCAGKAAADRGQHGGAAPAAHGCC